MAVPVTESRTPWRTDLQGLRVVAVLLVATYHVWFGRVSGGVDVFLMMSGFFVGGSLWRRFAANKPPKAGTYVARHVRRLVPAAVVVLAATAVGVVLLWPQTRWADAGGETIASLLFWQNWHLIAVGAEYGAADPSQSAWQHFWSISVQAQLFLLVPIVLWLVWHFSRRATPRGRKAAMATAISLVAVGSFALAVWLMATNPADGYLNTAARAWEFLAGMLLAMVLTVVSPRGWWWPVLSWFALAALFATGIFIDGAHTFPGVPALIPIGAAAVLVIAGAVPSRFGANRVLGMRWLASLGNYAYGFYLWHWPLLIFATGWLGRAPGWRAGTAILLASAVLAVLTYHLVEKPLREGDGASVRTFAIVWRRSVATLVTAAVVAMAFATTGWDRYVAQQKAEAFAQLGDLQNYPGAQAFLDPLVFGELSAVDPIPAPELVRWDTSVVLADRCVTTQGDAVPRGCEYVYGTTKRVALFGASHSEHLFEIADVLARSNRWTLVPVIKPACPPALPEDAGTPECEEWAANALADLTSGVYDLVITTSTRPAPGGGDYTPETYVRLFEALAPFVEILGVRDNPSFPTDMPECYLADDDCDFDVSEVLSLVFPDAALDATAVIPVDTNDLVCPNGTCTPVVGNRFVFRDSNHLTKTYVDTIAVEAARRWQEALVLTEK